MQRLKYLILALLFSTSILVVTAQVRFDNVRHDFGTILWNTPATATFKITNSSSDTLIIRDVRPDCGCTVAKWTRTPIFPGHEGTIEATYDAALLGHFEKQLAVYTNQAARPVYLTLSGGVARELLSKPENFSYRVGDLYLETDNVEFDDVRRGDMPIKTLQVYNAGKTSINIELMHLPKYLTVTAEPKSIRPGRTGRLQLTLNSNQLHTYGLTQTSVYVSRFAGDHVSQDNEVSVSATLLPEQSYTDEQLAIAPKAHLDSLTINMGSLGTKKRLRSELLLTNKGNSPLVITALQVYNPGLSVSLGKRKLAPGESDKLKITVNATTHGFKGRRRVLLITNDPVNPKVVIDIIVKK